MKLSYAACFYPSEELPGAYTVIVPDLPGCVTQGNSLPDAVFMAQDAASGWVLDELEEGRPAPSATPPNKVKADEFPNGFVSVLALDMDDYAVKHGQKAVRKNLTIPAWLNTMAERNHVNFSEILQRALERELRA